MTVLKIFCQIDGIIMFISVPLTCSNGFSEQIYFIGAHGFVPHVVFVRLVISGLYVDNVLIYYPFLISNCNLLNIVKHLQQKQTIQTQ